MDRKKPKPEEYTKYPFMNFSLESMENETWHDIAGFDGCYCISNYGRIWAAPRPILSTRGQLYFTKERIRKQNVTLYYNKHIKTYTKQLSVKLRYERTSHSFKVNRLVYHYFVTPINLEDERLAVVHKDGDNCNNRADNLVLMNGTQLYSHNLRLNRIPRTGRIIKKDKDKLTWSESNAPRPIIKYALDGKIVKTYASVAEAAKANKSYRVSIRDVASKKLVQLNGFIYRFKGDPYKGEHADFSYEKPVTQYELSGKMLKRYPSLKEAGRKNGLDSGTISKCALGKSRIAGGYVWRYDDNPYRGEFKNKIKNKAKKIVQYSLEGKVVARFDSANEASAQTGFTAATLLDCAHKRTRVSHGFVWRFENDSYRGEFKHYSVGKPVTQCSPEGKRLNTYHTIEEAAKASGLTSANIQKNVIGANKTAGGFIWRKARPEEVKKLSEFKPSAYTLSDVGGTEVIQYSIEGKKLAVYSSMTDAARAVGVSAGGISTVLNKATRSAGGFVWRTKGNLYRGALAKTPAANQAKKVTQYDLKGRKVGVYESTKKAEAATGVSATSISQVARGKLKSTGGYIWKYDDTSKRIDVEAHFASTREAVERMSKKVAKYTIEGEFVREYPSLRAAAIEEGIGLGRISSVVNGKSKSAGGFLWRLVE
ncbi:NUMOD1 domain-containing DNA-binding protein [Chryseolinea lacunae]|uniref:NUMOD1 domain-containing protein n=1 Tax=Chryseolinea lacunae TaxID=2801331 RepID=A0ABS1KXE7_9BACT|nr:NUMOD1 domain-containing DNA-binding protein [Chryseolinea lacunae]MBL0743878.1 hypothetical protein [Chryseolinea lacunae]